MNDVYQRIFLVPLGPDFADYFILNLARSIAGDIMKRICFCIGDTNCGKSTITKACENSFGGYIGNFDAHNLIKKEIKSDGASQLRWCLLIRNARIGFSNELSADEIINGGNLKKFSSGGDKLTARLHCSNEISFIPHFVLFVMLNDMNTIEPYDDAVDERLCIFNFKRRFTDIPKTMYDLKKDPNLKHEVETIRFKHAFMRIIVDRYTKFHLQENRTENVPKEIMDGKDIWVGDRDETNIICNFISYFTLTNIEKAKVYNNELENTKVCLYENLM